MNDFSKISVPPIPVNDTNMVEAKNLQAIIFTILAFLPNIQSIVNPVNLK